MIRITAKLNLKDGVKEEFIQLAKELVAKSQAEEGCIDYGLYQSRSEENTVTFIEGWKDMEAIATHNSSEHFTTFAPSFKEFVETQEITLYDLI